MRSAPLSASSVKARPSASSSAVSKLSARRLLQIVAHHHQAVDHHLDVVLALLVERRQLPRSRSSVAVDLDPLEAALLQVGQLLAVLALAAAHDGGQQVEPRALGHLHDPVDHLADGLAFDRQAGGGRVGHADPGDTAGAGSRRSRSPCRRSSAGSSRSSSARWRSPATALRWNRHRASASAPGTGGHRPRATRHSGAGPRHRWCRRRGRICRSPKAR